MESEMVKSNKKENDIDYRYYETMANDAVAAIFDYGDFEWFVSDDPYVKAIPDDKPPFDI